jgi:hypothetical protein
MSSVPTFHLSSIHPSSAQAQAQAGAAGGRGGKRGSGAGGSGAKDPLGISDFWWDAAGWVALFAAIGGIALMARGGAPGGAPPAAA